MWFVCARKKMCVSFCLSSRYVYGKMWYINSFFSLLYRQQERKRDPWLMMLEVVVILVILKIDEERLWDRYCPFKSVCHYKRRWFDKEPIIPIEKIIQLKSETFVLMAILTSSPSWNTCPEFRPCVFDMQWTIPSPSLAIMCFWPF